MRNGLLNQLAKMNLMHRRKKRWIHRPIILLTANDKTVTCTTSATAGEGVRTDITSLPSTWGGK